MIENILNIVFDDREIDINLETKTNGIQELVFSYIDNKINDLIIKRKIVERQMKDNIIKFINFSNGIVNLKSNDVIYIRSQTQLMKIHLNMKENIISESIKEEDTNGLLGISNKGNDI